MLKKLSTVAGAALMAFSLSACAAPVIFMPTPKAKPASATYTAPRFRGVPYFVYTPEVGTFVAFDAVQPTFFIQKVYLVREHGQWLASHTLAPTGPWVLVKPTLLSSALRHADWDKLKKLAFDRRADKKFNHFVILTPAQYKQLLAERAKTTKKH